MAEEVVVMAQRVVSSNSKWNVNFTHIAEGDREVPDYLVIEPKVRDANDVTGVVTLPVVGGRVGLVDVYRLAMRQVMREGPRGFLDPNESLTHAALRELEEETGLVCALSDLLDLGTATPEASTIAGRYKLFAALDCHPVGKMLDDEIGMRDIQYMSLSEAQALADSSKIEDCGTLVALYRLILRQQIDSNVRGYFEVRR